MRVLWLVAAMLVTAGCVGAGEEAVEPAATPPTAEPVERDETPQDEPAAAAAAPSAEPPEPAVESCSTPGTLAEGRHQDAATGDDITFELGEACNLTLEFQVDVTVGGFSFEIAGPVEPPVFTYTAPAVQAAGVSAGVGPYASREASHNRDVDAAGTYALTWAAEEPVEFFYVVTAG